jgi:uncharacterized protein YpbB
MLLDHGVEISLRGKAPKKKNFVPRPREDRITKKNHELEMGKKKKKNTLLWSTTRSNKIERKMY